MAFGHAKYELISVGLEYLGDILKLEPQIYSHGWSENLIKVEFENQFQKDSDY